MKRLIIGFYFTLSLAAQAQTMGQGGGNGGDVVVCKNDQGIVISSEILDVYEGKEMRKIDLQLGGASLSIDEKLKVLIDRLTQVSPFLAKHFMKEYDFFWKNASFLNNIELNDIPDSDHLYVPKGCEIKQIAIQRKHEFEEDKWLVVSNDLWRNLNNDNKLALITHEILYKIAIEKGHSDSRKVRYLNSLVLSDKILTYKGVKFAELISKLNLKDYVFTYVHEGYEFKTSEYSTLGNSIGGELVSSAVVNFLGNTLKPGKLYFYRAGTGKVIQSLNFETVDPQKFIMRDEGGKIVLSTTLCYYVNVNSDGSLNSLFGCANGNTSSYVYYQKQKISFENHLAFSEVDGSLKMIDATSPYYYSYFGNLIPLYKNIIFSNGTIDRHEIYVYERTQVEVNGVRFVLNKDDVLAVDESGRIIFRTFEQESTRIKFFVQENSFECWEPMTFDLNGKLWSCIIHANGYGVQLKKADGSFETAVGGDWIYFDPNGYLVRVSHN